MSKDKSGNWFKRHKILSVIGVFIVICIIASAAGGSKPSNSTTNSGTTASTSSKTEATAKQPDVSAEYKSALNQAGTYAKTAHMSKQGVYDQLVSEYGGKFTAPAAQYAIDNVKADWNANALAKAKDYQKQQSLSPSAIHDQLTSAAGEKFTVAEADYAIAHLND